MNHGLDTGFLVAATIAEHSLHPNAKSVLVQLLKNGDRFSIAPQVLAELIHILTDPKRFSKPLSVDDARDLAEQWWNATDVDHVYPDNDATVQFISWHRQYRLGRKRLLDTLLAATYQSAGVHSILTTNSRDFTLFAGLNCITP